jgi:hypothetical protein
LINTFVTTIAKSADFAPADFLSLCKVSLTKTPEHEQMCLDIHKKFFSKVKSVDIVPIKPSDVNAPSSPIDSKIQFIIFNDPNYVSGIAYCYFIYRKWINAGAISPDTFGTVVSGFSILNEDINQYQKWLSSTNEGKKCKMTVEKEAEAPVVNLKESLVNHVALIGLNPFASIKIDGATTSSVYDEMKVTLNHERIHAFQVMCPDFEKWSIKEWEKISAETKNEYIKKYNSYNWTIPKIAGREYVAFLYEQNPEKIGELVKNCKIK